MALILISSEEHYRKRTALMVNVVAGCCRGDAFWLQSFSKDDGIMITVDGGVPAAFTR